MQEIKTLSPDQLRPNEYNPNQMTDDEFAEVVAEVRHLGRLPKPVIVRANGDCYLIVDGEHGWRAATECGLETIPCEVIEADDFEAMRQTFKRNQHGTHDPVRLGQMFRQMMTDKGFSKRALAKEITVSEGTVRNAIAFTEMIEKYGETFNDKNHIWEKHPITGMTVKQIRYLAALPEPIGKYWLKKGADVKQLFYDTDGKPPSDHDLACVEATLPEYLQYFYEQKLSHVEYAPVNSCFSAAMKQIDKWIHWERYSLALAGLTPDQVRPYRGLAIR